MHASRSFYIYCAANLRQPCHKNLEKKTQPNTKLERSCGYWVRDGDGCEQESSEIDGISGRVIGKFISLFCCYKGNCFSFSLFMPLVSLEVLM